MTTENTENLPTVKEVTIPEIVGDSIFTDTARFVLAQRVANALASSSIVPESFRGNIGNCMIALNMAGRMELDVFMLMSSMYIVHGKPGLEGKLIIALINKSGLFRGPLRFEFKGEGDIRKCRAVANRNIHPDEPLCEGTWVTWAMVVAEGWNKRSDSKWNTMPDLMFQYRAASFFANIHCPEVKIGMQSSEELMDTAAASPLIPVHGTSTPETTTGKPNYDVTEKATMDDLTDPKNFKDAPPPKPIFLDDNGNEVEIKDKEPVNAPPGPGVTGSFTGHRTSQEGPPGGLKMDGSKKEEPPLPEPPKPEPIEAEHFYRKRQPAVQALLDAPGRVEATAGHILRMLWTKIENQKWDIQHPAYQEWKAAQTAGKAHAGKFTGAPTDKIGDDPDHTLLKKLHATIREMGLDPVGTQKVMFAKFDITSSKDITLQKATDAFSLLDALIPVNGLSYLLQNVQKITDKAGKKVNVIALAISKIREFSPKITGEITDLYEIYDKPQVIEWVQDSMDEWIAAVPDPAKNQSAGPPDMPPQKQQPLESKILPTLKTVMDAVNYAADLTGTSKADLWSPEFTKLASDTQVFIKEGFDISLQELAAGLPDGTAEKMREHFVKFIENMSKA